MRYGSTKNRKAETLIDPASGLRKRVFFGQRFLTVHQRDESDKPLVRAHATEEAANKQIEMDRRFGCMVEYVSKAIVVSEKS